MIATFYSHYVGFDKIIDTLHELYPKALLTTRKDKESHYAELIIKGGLFSTDKKINISYRQKEKPSYVFSEEDSSPLAVNINGLYNYVSSLPTTKPEVKNLLLRKIETINCEFSIWQEEGDTKKLKPLIERLALAFDAIIFAQPDTPISRSDNQHFLDKYLNLILDTDGRCEVEKLDVQIESKYYDADQSKISAEQLERKAANEAFLINKKIKINSHLPCIESEAETTIRTPREIATRVCVLAVINFVAFEVISAENAIDYLKEYQLWDDTTPNEKNFLLNPTVEKRIAETWKSECIWTLFWALGKVDELGFPEELCNLNDIPPSEYPVGGDKDPNIFINAANNSKTVKELLDINDLYYRLDWACVDARLNGHAMETVQPGVVYERHYALNWLIRYADAEWDEVTCDT
ncbi:DUF4272 domain-containing protein [Pedobacter miscanthi]|uniref:DUF4272 domain-containing protein n=1 Tax=Pedobacter miscanthi TaxID=2259170 RepID=A0A366L842_9SPHI|nr:DUF4272 domain-containing protein [Pedobacter miscanthi]RBQ09960.1 DUF4272 domain-containing protein [Pedobacter miscanthi]